MDIYLREAVVKYLEDGSLNDTVLKTGDKRHTFVKFCRSLSLKNGRLYYKGRSDVEPKLVPSPQDVDECLNEKHIRVVGRHLRDRGTLVKALSNAGYSHPINLGGLGALVDE